MSSYRFFVARNHPGHALRNDHAHVANGVAANRRDIGTVPACGSRRPGRRVHGAIEKFAVRIERELSCGFDARELATFRRCLDEPELEKRPAGALSLVAHDLPRVRSGPSSFDG